MQALYNAGIQAYGLAVKLAAPKNPKARQWLSGRKNWRQKLRPVFKTHDRPIWVHAASLGEMEAGLPIVEKVRERYPHKKILISFFSPSGYENFKDKHLAEHICYLPLDTPKNARDFVKIVNPSLALFIKYEIWINYFKTLQAKQIPLILAPALFREKQFFFSYLAWPFYRKIFGNISQILVQNQASLNLLQSKGLQNVSLCGDTRFDRVMALTQQEYRHNQKFQNFLGNSFCLIGGSTWPPEEEILLKALAQREDFKLILAPHLIDVENIERLAKEFKPYGLSKFSAENWDVKNRVLLIDNIGHLKLLYRFGHFALVGGAFGPGVHSTIEPVAYGLPVAFGPNHQKFIEPGEMIARGFGFEIKTASDFISIINQIIERPAHREQLQSQITKYLTEKGGAAQKITTWVEKCLKSEVNS